MPQLSRLEMRSSTSRNTYGVPAKAEVFYLLTDYIYLNKSVVGTTTTYVSELGVNTKEIFT